MIDPDFFGDVIKFHRTAGIAPAERGPCEMEGEIPDATLLALRSALRQLRQDGRGMRTQRVSFLIEELAEYVNAIQYGDLVGQLDALCDILYVTLGAADIQGFPLNRAWLHVHAANMRKIPADGPRRDASGKIQKPEGWIGPEAQLQIAIDDAKLRHAPADVIIDVAAREAIEAVDGEDTAHAASGPDNAAPRLGFTRF